MKKKSLVLNAFLNGLRNVLNLIFPLITFPYITRILSVSGIGRYNFANSIVSYFILIAGLGIGTYGIREGAKYRDNPKKESDFVSEVYSLNIISSLLAYGLLALLIIFSDKVRNEALLIAIFSIQIIFTTLGVEWVFSIYEEYTYITVRSIFFKVISIILLFIFVRDNSDVYKYAMITVFSSVGSNVLNYIKVKEMINIKFTLNISWKKRLVPILVLFASTIAIQIYANSGITILGFIRNSYEVGLYSVSAKIYTIVKNGIAALLIVTIPRLAMLWGKGRIEEYKKLFNNLLNVVVMVLMPTIIGLFTLSKQIIVIISGKEYIAASSSLKILCIALACSIISWMFNDGVLIPAKREKYMLYSTMISAILNIIFSLMFVKKFGQTAVAAAVLLAEITGMILNIYWSRDIIKLNDMVKMDMSVILGCILIYVECNWISKVLNGNMFIVIVSIFCSVVTYSLVLALFKNRYCILIIQSLKKKRIKNSEL